MTLAPPQPTSAAGGRPRTRADAAATRARLRRLIADIESRPRKQATLPTHPTPPPFEDPDTTPRNLLASATRRETPSGELTYREVRYPITHTAGHQPLADITPLSPETLTLLAPEEGLEDARLEDLYFLDIETTGLGGAGAIAFLVATARFEVDESGIPQDLVLTQYLAESPPEENSLLEALIEDARFRDDPVLVTYNGRAFDAPMLDERATMHRRRAGFDGLRQLDLLRPARRSYRSLLANCKLNTLEHQVLGMTRPSEDIPGAEVPHWYFRFLRTGDQRMLNPIVEHNELDIIGMVGLLAWLAAHLDSGRVPGQRDALGLGRLLAAEGHADRAITYLEQAISDAPHLTLEPSPSPEPEPPDLLAHSSETAYFSGARPAPEPPDDLQIREEALLRLARLHKRAGARDRAAQLWQEALALPARTPLEPLIELAMHYEHHLHDFDAAISHARRAGDHVSTHLRRHDPPRATRLLEAINHRLTRLHSRAERARRSA